MKKMTKAELEGHNAWLQNRVNVMAAEIADLKKQLTVRVDTSMIAERRALLNSLGQMTEAVSHAIRFTVGKEVM
jgi:hypothetical protein